MVVEAFAGGKLDLPTRLEPGAYDQKVYAPGIGIAREQALTGAAEFAELVSVTG